MTELRNDSTSNILFVGSAYDYFGEISDEDANFLQVVVWDTVNKVLRIENWTNEPLLTDLEK